MAFYPMLFLPVAAALLAFVWLLISASRKALLSTLVLSSLAVCVLCTMLWLLRDGLAPGFVESTGVEAWRRFLDGAEFPLVIWGIIVFTSLGSYWLRHKRAVGTV